MGLTSSKPTARIIRRQNAGTTSRAPANEYITRPRTETNTNTNTNVITNTSIQTRQQQSRNEQSQSTQQLRPVSRARNRNNNLQSVAGAMINELDSTNTLQNQDNQSILQKSEQELIDTSKNIKSKDKILNKSSIDTNPYVCLVTKENKSPHMLKILSSPVNLSKYLTCAQASVIMKQEKLYKYEEVVLAMTEEYIVVAYALKES